MTPPLNIALLDRYTWKLRNALAEARLNVHTSGMYLDPANPDSCCSKLTYRSTRAVLDAMRLRPRDVFFDIGCGKGRVLCCAAQVPLRRVVGIEMNPEAAAAARANSARMRGRRAPVQVIEGDARKADYTDGTAFYLFNPFGADVLRAVLERIRATLDYNPRSVRFAYTYPRHEFVLEGCGWLQLTDSWPTRPDLGISHQTSFWQSRDS